MLNLFICTKKIFEDKLIRFSHPTKVYGNSRTCDDQPNATYISTRRPIEAGT
jgi:hypothetical protein